MTPTTTGKVRIGLRGRLLIAALAVVTAVFGAAWWVATATSSADAIRGRLLATFGAGVVLTAIVLVIVGTRLLGPLRRLAHATAAADPTALAVESSDEVGAITAVFNQMVEKVQASKGDLAHEIVKLERLQKQLVVTERLEKELVIASSIQTTILPKKPQVRGVELSARMLPALEAGGDYYDIINVDGGCWIGIGDVAGHGLTAGLVMLMVQSVVSALITTNPDATPSEVIRVVNAVIYDNVRNRLGQDEHVTLTLLRYHASGKIAFAGAHEDLLVWRRATGICESIPTVGTWVGAIRDVSAVTKDTAMRLDTGDLLVLYTDGVTETMNRFGEQFGVERLRKIIETHSTDPVETIRDVVMEASTLWSYQPPDDDITIVVFRHVGGG